MQQEINEGVERAFKRLMQCEGIKCYVKPGKKSKNYIEPGARNDRLRAHPKKESPENRKNVKKGLWIDCGVLWKKSVGAKIGARD